MVLVVEDNDDIRSGMTALLESDGYRAEGACNGQEALELLSQSPKPALITLDLSMPVMDGTTFLVEMKKRPSCVEIPVVIVSAHEPPDVLPAVYAGHLRKPASFEKLLSVVRSWTASRP